METDKGKSQTTASYLVDTLQNLVANLGTGRDKSVYSTFVDGIDIGRDRTLADTIYRFQWMSKIVDILPYDMVRQWRTWFSLKATPEQIKEIELAEKRLQYKSNMQEALTWGRLYGGCAIVLSVDGHGDASIELDVTKIKKGQLKRLLVIDRHRLFPQIQTIITDPASPFFGEPERYLLVQTETQNTQLIHRSRLVKFIGQKAPYWPRKRLLLWGDSILTRIYDVMRDSETVISSIASMVQESTIDIIQVEGLADALSSDGDEKIKERFALLALMKAINNMMLLDDTEKYDRKPTDFKQLPQLMQQFLALLASASDIPATRLLGKSPDGMNATGKGDLVNYYDNISSKQESDMEDEMRYIDQAMIRSLLGEYPEGLDWRFNSLWQLTELEQADLDVKRTNKLLDLQALGVPDEVILKDIQEQGLSHNLDDKAMKKALKELEEVGNDDDTDDLLNGEEDETEESDDKETDTAVEPGKSDT